MITTIKQQTIPILFAGGAYGTFVDWCLHYFSGQLGNELPFNANGNSHKYRGIHLINMNGWREYLDSNKFYPIVRFHPKTLKEESIQTSLDDITGVVNQAVLLYSTEDLFLLNLNNKFEKIFKQGWLRVNEHTFLDNLAGWNKKHLDEMAIWELREFLSLYLWRQHLSEVELDTVKLYTNPKLLKINIRDLFTDFESTITRLLTYCGLPVVHNNFTEIHSDWLVTQQHKDKDKLVATIVDAIINGAFMDWSKENLTIVDEAIVQMYLRDLHDLDMLCYNVNEFPTNTTDLQKLLINE